MPRLLIVAVVLIALGGGGLFLWDWLSKGQQGTSLPRPVAQANRSSQDGTFTSPVPPVSSESSATSSPASSDQLLARIAGLEARLAQVAPPTAPAQASAADAQIAQLQARVASLETALTVERSRADRAQQTVRDTTERLQKTVRAAGALARLRTNLERGYPFEHEFDDANAALSSDANAVARLQPLRQWAESGIASRADLRSALDGLGADIVRAALLEGAQTWWQAIVARVKSLVIVRPTPDGDIPQAGTAEGDRPPAIVARAEARLNDDDIPGSLNELSALTGAAADVAQGWMATARARVSADEIMASLDDSLRGSLSGSSGSGSSVGSVSNPAPVNNAPDDTNGGAVPSDNPSAGEP